MIYMHHKTTKRIFSIFMIVLLVLSLLPVNIAAEEVRKDEKFTDLDSYETEIYQLVKLGIINGYPDQTFRPYQAITRAQGVAMIIREMKLDTSNRPEPNFKDIDSNYRFYNEIATAVDEGIIDGFNDRTFRPNDEMTRSQMAKILVGAYQLKLQEVKSKNFKDVPASHWAYDYIKILASNGITEGYKDGTFNPSGSLNRLHFSLFLYRYINEVKGKSENADLDKEFELKADKTKITYGESVSLTIKNKTELDYKVNWKTSGGKLTVADDEKSAVWEAENNSTKDYTVTVTIEVTIKSGKKVTFDKSVPIAVTSKSGSSSGGGGSSTPADDDKDGLSNKKEKELGTDPSNPDTDGDGLTDGEEVNTHKSDPLKADTDEDGLYDAEELNIYKTNLLKKDTDEDGLLDFYEVNETGTSPLLIDTDGNGVNDGLEDLDGDNLSNLQEQELKTDPQKNDTDFDKLSDGEEVAKGTAPLNADTDGDNLLDGEEEALSFNPLLKDTDGDGVIDGDEVIQYQTTPNKFNQNELVTPSVIIKTKASEGSSTTITNLDGHPLLNEDIPGYIGPAYDFNTNVDFTEAKMVFTYDESVVTDNFRPEIFYFNEAEQRLDRLENQSHDPSNNTVTVTVNHFSKYILLNGEEWDKAWDRDIRPPSVDDDGKMKNIDIVFAIDSSGSMTSNDRNGLRKKAASQFVDALKDTDRAAVVDFDSYSRVLIHLTNDKDAVKVQINSIDSSGGTNLYAGLQEAVNEALDHKDDETKDNLKYVIFLTDGDGTWNDSVLQHAKENGVVIYTIGLGNGVQKALLEKIATETGGKYYFASEAEELEELFRDTAEDTVKYTLDEDLDENGNKVGDGIPDYLEVEGIRNGLGVLIKTDPKVIDTDGDGLKDGEEFSITVSKNGDGKIYFKEFSNPLVKDTDGDGIIDGKENLHERMVYNFTHHHALMFSELAYVNMESFTKYPGAVTIPGLTKPDKLGKEISEQFSHGLANPGTELEDWYLIAAEDSHFFDSGFGAFAAKREDMIVISYRGSDNPKSLNVINDWLIANRKILFEGGNKQADYAKEFAAEIVREYPNAKVYIVGHSLGGFLAQVVAYHMETNTLDNVYHSFWNKKAKNEVKTTLQNPDYYQFTRTFNAAPFFKEEALEEIGEAFGLPRWLIPKVGKDPAVPIEQVSNSRFDHVIFNYSTSWDFLHLVDLLLENAEKIGSDEDLLEYQYKGKKSDEITTLKEVLDNFEATKEAHKLVHFYPYAEDMKKDEDGLR